MEDRLEKLKTELEQAKAQYAQLQSELRTHSKIYPQMVQCKTINIVETKIKRMLEEVDEARQWRKVRKIFYL